MLQLHNVVVVFVVIVTDVNVIVIGYRLFIDAQINRRIS